MNNFKHTAIILTISDKASNNERCDTVAPILNDILNKHDINIIKQEIVADSDKLISEKLIYYSDIMNVSVVVTTGGTGLSPRDVTPEATLSVIHRQVPGISEIIRIKGLQHTPYSSLSRGICGIRNNTLIINLPGSPNGALEGIKAVIPILKHGLDKLKGDSNDCVIIL